MSQEIHIRRTSKQRREAVEKKMIDYILICNKLDDLKKLLKATDHKQKERFIISEMVHLKRIKRDIEIKRVG